MGILIASLRVNFGEVLLEIHFTELPRGSTMSQSVIYFKRIYWSFFIKKGIIKLFTEKACQIFKKLFIYLWLFWVLTAAQASLAVMTGGYSNRSVRSMDLRAPRLQELRHVGSGVVAHGLNCSSACSSWIRDWIYVYCIGRWILHTELPEKPYFSLNKNHLKQSKDLVRSGACPSLTGCWKQFGDPPGVGNGARLWCRLHTPHAETGNGAPLWCCLQFHMLKLCC